MRCWFYTRNSPCYDVATRLRKRVIFLLSFLNEMFDSVKFYTQISSRQIYDK